MLGSLIGSAGSALGISGSSGGSSFLGSLFGGHSTGMDGGAAILSGLPIVGPGFAAQQQQNFSAKQAGEQMAFQKMMSDTAHQRQVADLKKAGLNPILAANKGASTPVGAMASGAYGSGSEQSAKMIDRLMTKEAQKADTLIDKQKQESKLLKASEEREKKQSQLLQVNALKAAEERDLLHYSKEKARVEHDYYKRFGAEEIMYNRAMDAIEKLIGTGQSAFNLRRMFQRPATENSPTYKKQFKSQPKSGGGRTYKRGGY